MALPGPDLGLILTPKTLGRLDLDLTDIDGLIGLIPLLPAPIIDALDAGARGAEDPGRLKRK